MYGVIPTLSVNKSIHFYIITYLFTRFFNNDRYVTIPKKKPNLVSTRPKMSTFLFFGIWPYNLVRWLYAWLRVFCTFQKWLKVFFKKWLREYQECVWDIRGYPWTFHDSWPCGMLTYIPGGDMYKVTSPLVKNSFQKVMECTFLVSFWYPNLTTQLSPLFFLFFFFFFSKFFYFLAENVIPLWAWGSDRCKRGQIERHL